MLLLMLFSTISSWNQSKHQAHLDKYIPQDNFSNLVFRLLQYFNNIFPNESKYMYIILVLNLLIS